MLKKLIKHEFRATSRVMWPIFIGMVLLAIMTRVAAIPLLNNGAGFFISAISILVLFCLGLGTFALAFAPMVVSGVRFKRGILGDEGYLTMTLPVTSHQILTSRLITNAIWYALTAVLVVLIGMLMISGYGDASMQLSGKAVLNFFREMSQFIGQLVHSPYTGHVFLVLFEIIVDMVMFVTTFTLVVYLSYSIGFSAKRHKNLWTVLLIYGLFHVTGWIAILTLIFFGERDARWVGLETGIAGFEGFLAICFLIMVVVSAVYYVVTNFFITRKLNLE